MKLKMICSHCRGENVVADAYAAWNVEEQEWQVESIFTKGAYCDDCQGETRIDVQEVEDETQS